MERARAYSLTEGHAEEGFQEGRHCGRAAGNSVLSAHIQIADDLLHKDHPSLPGSAPPGWRTRKCTREREALRGTFFLESCKEGKAGQVAGDIVCIFLIQVSL